MRKRLNVGINDECAAALKAHASTHDVTVTEAVRRAISIQAFVDAELAKGNHLAVVAADGHVLYELPKASS